MSGFEFKKAELVGSDELIGSGALIAAARKRLAANGIDSVFKSSFVTSAGYGDKAHLIVHASLDNGLTLPLLAHPWAYDEKALQRAANHLCQRWQEALARREGLAQVVDKARARIEAALGRNGGTARLLTVGLGTHDICYGINMRQVAIVAEIERLDARLEPEIVRLDCEIAKDIIDVVVAERSSQKQRAARRARLAAKGGRFEIDAVAMAAIEACGRTVEDVASELLNGMPSVALSVQDGSSPSKLIASVMEGRIVVVGHIGGDDRSFHLIDRLIVARPAFAASELTPLAGRPVHSLFDHPATRAAGRIGAIDNESERGNQTIFRLGTTRKSVVGGTTVTLAS